MFAKLFSSRRHTLVTYVIIHIHIYVLGDRKEIVKCYGGNRKEIMRCGGTVIEDKLESFGSSKFSQNMSEVTRRALGFLVMMELMGDEYNEASRETIVRDVCSGIYS